MTKNEFSEALALSLTEIPPLVKTSSSDPGMQVAISRLARMLAEDSERFDSGRFFRRIAERVEQQTQEEPT